jgi:putative glutamine amidotransferase
VRPLIGITGRQLTLGLMAKTSPRFRDRRINMYFTDFAECVARAGGAPVDLPFVSGETGVIDRLEGLIVTGGQDVHPARWGGTARVDPDVDPRWAHDAHDAERDAYEASLIEAALIANIPILGVCRGHQLLNVVMGGTLIEHLDAGPIVHATEHLAPSAGDPAHLVEFVEGSWAHSVYGSGRVVNSWHHQAVDRLGRGITVSGRTSDGVVECIALEDRPVVGVQWHPEWSAQADPIFGWLVDRSAEAAERRGARVNASGSASATRS